VACNTLRDRDGLALSSRNLYLSEESRKRALSISKSLNMARKMVVKGEKSSSKIKSAMRNILEKDLDLLEYIAIVDYEFRVVDEVKIGDSIILVAGKVGDVRLIDNIWL